MPTHGSGKFDACLLTDEEWALGPEGWQRFSDPFPVVGRRRTRRMTTTMTTVPIAIAMHSTAIDDAH